MAGCPSESKAGSPSPDGDQGRQIPGDRVRHSPSLGSDQEGAELPGWWQRCHSRVPCVTLCGPDAACRREGGRRGSWGSFPGTAGVTGGLALLSSTALVAHPRSLTPHPALGRDRLTGCRGWWCLGTGVLPPGPCLCTNPHCPGPPNLPAAPLGSPRGDQMASPSAPRGDRDGGQPGAPG